MRVDVPGSDVIDQLIDEAEHPQVLTSLPPMDLGVIRDNGAKALVALARAARWNVVQKPGSPIVLMSRTGVKLILPSDSAIRFSVFSQRAHAIARHSTTVIITDGLIEDIISRIKLDHSHAKVLRELPRQKMPPEDELPTPEQIIEMFPPDQQEEEPVASSDGLDVYTDEPFTVHDGMARPYTSPSTKRRTWTDGRVEYVCTICDFHSPNQMAVVGHFGVHVKRGETLPISQMDIEYGEPDKEWMKQGKRRNAERAAAGRRTMGKPSRPRPEQAKPKLAPKVTLDSETVSIPNEVPLGDITIDTVAEMVRTLITVATQQITAERDAALTEVKRLQGNLDALRDLLKD